MMRFAVPCALLAFTLTGSGCASSPRPAAEKPGQQNPDVSPTLKAREGLSFNYHGAVDGSNTDPRFDATEYEASDGERVTSEWYSFKHREGAAKYYSGLLARARTVLDGGGQINDMSSTAQQRAVIEFVTGDGRPLAAVVELSGNNVNEVIGPTAGHVLAFEKWRELNK
jgi:hypothetical protein